MPYRELPMIDVNEVLRRWSAGQGDRQIAREAFVDRKTIARYLQAAHTLGLERGGVFTEEQVHQVAQRVQARAARPPSDAMRLEQWDKTAKVTFDKRVLSELVSLRFLETHRHVCTLDLSAWGKHSSPMLLATWRVAMGIP